jgi:hypothetical protein
MFTDPSPVDQLAINQIHELQGEVRRTMDTERSRQKQIGISEIGDECDKCVARKLSRLYDDMPDNPSWKAQVGTFIHAGLEEHWRQQFPDRTILGPQVGGYTDDRPFYANERQLDIWTYRGLTLAGSCDLFVQGETYGIVVDWKTQGPKKLAEKTAKGDIGQTYTVQMHTYGLGYHLLGLNVTHVLLYALPRDGELDDAKPVLMRWDPSIATNALKRLKNLIDVADIIGWEETINTRTAAGFCFGCKDFAKAEAKLFHDGLFGN